MILEKNLNEERRSLKATDLEEGDLAILLDEVENKENIVLRIFERLVSLSNPGYDWDEHEMPFKIVRKLNKGESVTLIQE